MSQNVEKTFNESLGQNLNLSALTPESQKYLRELAKHQSLDFSSSHGGYFSNESQEQIAKESATRLAKALSEKGLLENLEMREIQEEWQKIVMDFHRSGHWNVPTQKQKPKKILSEEQKRTRELFPYIWILFQAWIVMKLVISYFGLESADHPEETPWFLYLAIAFSFCNLVYFAWNKSKKYQD